MTPKLMLLTAKMLRLASEEFSNHCCNDMDQDILKEIGFTEEEKEEICADYKEYNGCGDPTYEPKFDWIMDCGWMNFLANKLEKESHLEPDLGVVV